ncbi:MAG: choline dehydrogenase [Rhodospirillaceae bacterium]|nr:choline dehydrogenase [Rhodospirillaceae bacterium]|tara:strand:+ start:809 stop:2446 length:1638 start_codon:yes stop_codon:yes gene_type:complete
MAENFDYVIVGSGSAGSVMATRLSEDPDVRVLVLEVGSNNKDFRVYMPTANAMALGRPKFDWNYLTEPQPYLANRQVYWPRGRGLGGSSAINGMIYIRGNARDYDRWRQLGLEGWAYGDVLPYFKKAESREGGGDQWRGDDGPLLTGPAGGVLPIEEAFVEACVQSGLPRNPDFNGAGQVGGGILDFTIRDGKRSSVARCYLGSAKGRPNLEIRTGSFVTGLVLENGRAVGARFERNGRMEEARADREMIVCQGAIGSPQLLMLSGIGPADHLRGKGIDVVADVPGVGQNLQDHLNIPVQFACTDPVATFDRWQQPHRALWLGASYFLSGGKLGPGGNAFWSAGAFSLGEADDPEFPKFQVFFTPMVVQEDSRTRKKTASGGFEFDVNQMHPEARGYLELRSADPRDHPVMDPRYLSEERDRREFVDAVKWARELAHQPAFDPYRGTEMQPGEDARTDAEILAGVEQHAISGYHPVGTCKMGLESDPLAVTDLEGRVRGVENLRVVDASLMPILVTGNTNAPTVMMSEKIADAIRGRGGLPRAEV